MITDLEIKFTVANFPDVTFKWIGGESFLISDKSGMNYFPIGQGAADILISKQEITHALTRLVAKVRA